MAIQDAHTHFFSRPFFETLAELSPQAGDTPALLQAVSQKTGLEIPGADIDAHTDRWLAEMDAHDVERMVCFASLPPEAPAVAAAARRSAGRLLPYTLVNPTADAAPGFTTKSFEQLGFRGLLTFPAMHHFLADDACCHPVYELARAHDAPIIVHCGILSVKLRDLLGLPRPYDMAFANPLSLVPAANRFPDVRFVVPHFGGGFLRETLMLGAQCENVFVDTSSSNTWRATQPSAQPDGLGLAAVFRSTLDVFGTQRVLFGSDSSTFPRGYRTDVRDEQLAALSEAGVGESDVEAIMGGNLAALLPARDQQPASASS